MTFRVRLAVGSLLIAGMSGLCAPLAAAEPVGDPTTTPAPGSTDEELVDMVLEALEHQPPPPAP